MVDKEGDPVRDNNSTTYIGAIETSEEFGKRLCAEAIKRDYVLSKSLGGKTKSQRIKNKDLETVKTDVREYNRFIKLTDEFNKDTQRDQILF